MRYQGDIITFLKELAANVNYFPGIGWWHFKYGSYQMVYIPANNTSDTIRICIPHFDEANQYELIDSAGTYYLPKDNNIEPIKYIITDNSGFKAVYVIARDLETSEVGLYRLDYKANLTLAKDPSPFKGSLRLDELSPVRLYENAEKY